MPDTMIERMARVFLKAGPSEDCYVGDRDDFPDALDSMTFDGEVDLVAGMKAILTAMREPTEGMVEAGDEAARSQAYTRDGEAEWALDGSGKVFAAMIDAALAEAG